MIAGSRGDSATHNLAFRHVRGAQASAARRAADAGDGRTREPSSEGHSPGELGAELAVVFSGARAGKEHLRGEGAGMECDGDAVASEGWNNSGLVADAPNPARLNYKIAIRNGRDGERARPEWRGAIEKLAQLAIAAQDESE